LGHTYLNATTRTNASGFKLGPIIDFPDATKRAAEAALSIFIAYNTNSNNLKAS